MTGNRLRLSHSRAGFMRMVMMSQDKLFVIVEGRELDTPFYSGICESSHRVSRAGYQVWLIEQIEDANGKPTGGKKGLLSLFEYCKSQGKLRYSTPLGEKSFAFCLDRDNENVTGGLKRSGHLIYTRLNDVESEIFSQPLNERVIMASLSIDRDSARRFLWALGDWRLDLSNAWKEWIELCCLAKAIGARTDVGFSKESIINGDRYGKMDAAAAASARARVLSRSNFDATRTMAIEKRVSDKIGKIYATGDPRTLLHGKWLSKFLAYRAKDYFAGKPVAFQYFEGAVTRVHLYSLDYSAPWVDYYREKLHRLLS